jgi:hypothetical protein
METDACNANKLASLKLNVIHKHDPLALISLPTTK